MIVGNPFWHYALAEARPAPEVAPLIDAIRKLEVRPFRLISHDTMDGKVFNAAFFEDTTRMNGFLRWYLAEVLAEGGRYHSSIAHVLQGAAWHRHCPHPHGLAAIIYVTPRIIVGPHTGRLDCPDTAPIEDRCCIVWSYTAPIFDRCCIV